jgi:hypothetical protein
MMAAIQIEKGKSPGGKSGALGPLEQEFDWDSSDQYLAVTGPAQLKRQTNSLRTVCT